MRSNSGLEEEIGVLPIRAWRKKLRFNSGLEEEITSGLQEEIEIPRKKLRLARKKLRSSRKKSLRAWEEIT